MQILKLFVIIMAVDAFMLDSNYYA